MNWVSQLEVNPKTGHAATTVENIRIIVKNDPRFKGTFYWDEFMERPMVCGDLPCEKPTQSRAHGMTPMTQASQYS